MDHDVAQAPAEGDLLDRVRDAWAEVLEAPDASDVPLDTNFLDAGGSSLLLIMLWEELHELTDIDLRVSDLFMYATVRTQAALLAGEKPQEAPALGAKDRGRLLQLRGERP